MTGSGPSVLDRLYRTIESRKGADPAASYTAQLIAAGRGRIARKLGEEGVEAALACAAGERAALVAESADVIYHLLVAWAEAGIRPAEVWTELERREGTSGIEEKRSRSKR